jgi:hypothetical protein
MADTKITGLASATAATGQEIPVNTGGTDNKITVGAILNLLAGVYVGDIGTSGAPIRDIYLSGVTGQGRIFKSDTQVGLLKSVTFISTTGQTYDPPDGVNFIIVEAIGAGGSGASMAAATTGNAASGGGGGGYARKVISAATLGTAAVTITLGTGGAVGATAAGGAAGTATVFGAFCTACGGQGGATGVIAANGGAGGAATSGNINITGSDGGASWGAGATAAALARRLGGRGGNSYYGFGGRDIVGITGTILAGSAGLGFGAGGGGGLSVPAAASGAVGGAGTAGLVIVWEYV